MKKQPIQPESLKSVLPIQSEWTPGRSPIIGPRLLQKIMGPRTYKKQKGKGMSNTEKNQADIMKKAKTHSLRYD